MKKRSFLFLFLFLFLTACGHKAEPSPPLAPAKETPSTETVEISALPAENDVIPEYPPALTLTYAEETHTALQGTSSWTYQTGEESFSVCADSVHPLQAKDRMPFFLTSETDTVSLLWEIPPDAVFARCYESDAWGTYDAKSTNIPVMSLQICSDKEEEPQFHLALKEGNYIYEITAEWNASELWGGRSNYSFYTLNHID